jgi:hypothetical protein
VIDPENAAAYRRFAAAALTGKPKDFAFLYLKTDVIHRLHIINLPAEKALGHRKIHLQVFHL